MALTISQLHWSQLRQHGEETYPHESCGVLVGEAGSDGAHAVRTVVRCRNTRLDSPHSRYHIDPKELVRIQREAAGAGQDIIGFYHSHPDGAAMWSANDLEEAHWLGCAYVITSVQRGTAAQTCAFVLEGEEANKRFREERIHLAGTGGEKDL